MFYMNPISGYLGKITTEALSVQFPVLDGPWELVAWYLVYSHPIYFSHEYGVASDRLTAWLVKMIGNPDIS